MGSCFKTWIHLQSISKKINYRLPYILIVALHCEISRVIWVLELVRYSSSEWSFDLSSIVLCSHHSLMSVNLRRFCRNQLQIVWTFREVQFLLVKFLLEISRFGATWRGVIGELVNICWAETFFNREGSICRKRIFIRILKGIHS